MANLVADVLIVVTFAILLGLGAILDRVRRPRVDPAADVPPARPRGRADGRPARPFDLLALAAVSPVSPDDPGLVLVDVRHPPVRVAGPSGALAARQARDRVVGVDQVGYERRLRLWRQQHPSRRPSGDGSDRS